MEQKNSCKCELVAQSELEGAICDPVFLSLHTQSRGGLRNAYYACTASVVPRQA